MDSPAVPYKAAEEVAVRARQDLAEAMGLETPRVYFEVPENAPLPYVVLGQHEIDTDDYGDCGSAHEVVSTVQWWTKTVGEARGSDVARQMGAALVAALLNDLEVTGYSIVLTEMEGREAYNTEPDGSTRGRVIIRTELTPLA